MLLRTLSAAGVVLGLASPAIAGSWDAAKAVCAEAIAEEAGVDLSQHDATLEKARDGATQRLTVSLEGPDGAIITGECKVRGGEVKSVTLEA